MHLPKKEEDETPIGGYLIPYTEDNAIYQKIRRLDGLIQSLKRIQWDLAMQTTVDGKTVFCLKHPSYKAISEAILAAECQIQQEINDMHIEWKSYYYYKDTIELVECTINSQRQRCELPKDRRTDLGKDVLKLRMDRIAEKLESLK